LEAGREEAANERRNTMTTKLFATRRALMIGAIQATATLMLPRRSWAETLPKMTVTRDPNCGCCGGWVTHVKAAGFPVEVIEAADLAPLKARLGVPDALISCHTAEIGSYVVEGHVPADAIKRLLVERPRATGLAVAGMPIGSPGMEVSGTLPETYEVVLFGQGQQRVFARYRGSQAL
jgi:hypothetical protein